MSEEQVNEDAERIVKAYEQSPTPIAKIVDEVVDMVNNLSHEEAQRIENDYWMRTYRSTEPWKRGYKSFWD